MARSFRPGPSIMYLAEHAYLPVFKVITRCVCVCLLTGNRIAGIVEILGQRQGTSHLGAQGGRTNKESLALLTD